MLETFFVSSFFSSLKNEKRQNKKCLQQEILHFDFRFPDWHIEFCLLMSKANQTVGSPNPCKACEIHLEVLATIEIGLHVDGP